MLYNKTQLKKVNDKKVLHKIKKHWAVISVALLGLVGGTITATKASANTNVNSQDNDNQANHSLDVNQIYNQQPKLVNNNQTNYSNQLNSYKNTSSESSIDSNQAHNITSLANQLHNNILINRINNNSLASQSIKLGNRYSAESLSGVSPTSSEALKSNTSFNNSLKSVVVTPASESRSIHNNVKPASITPYTSNKSSSVNSSTASSVSFNNAKSNNNHKDTSSVNAIKTGTYDGLTYKYDPTSRTVEFTDGQLTWNGNGKNAFIGAGSKAPHKIRLAQSIKFDKGINMSHVTDMHNILVWLVQHI